MFFKKKWKLYELINKYPNSNVFKLSSMICWSHKKTRKYLEQLIKDGLIKSKPIYDIKLYYPVDFRTFLKKDEMNI